MSKQTSYLVSLCVIAMMLIPVGDAHAVFWDGVGKMSGPGPFTGVNVVYPFRIGTTPQLDAEMLQNPGALRILNNYYLLFPLQTDPLALVNDVEMIRFLGERYDIDAFKNWSPSGKTVDDLLLEFDDALAAASFIQARIGSRLRRSSTPGSVTSATELLRELNHYILAEDDEVREHFEDRYRRPGWSKVWGLFTSTAALRLPGKDSSNNVVNQASNQYVTVALGYAQSLENDLPYPDENTESKTVRWLMVYPAYERRFGLTQDGTKNFFANAGPALHRFSGAAFATFYKASVRGRVGWRYHSFSFGGQLEYFVNEIKHTEFGSADNGVHRWSYGFFTNIELPGFSR